MAAPNRYYSSTASEATLTAAMSGGTTTINVDTTSGYPSSTPFTLVIDPGLTTEEVVTVTNLGGLILTVVRGADGTSAVPHDAGATVRHGLSARDLREPQEHIAATNGVHGAVGEVVGNSDAQALTNKTLDGTLNTFTNLQKASLPATTVYTTDTQTLTNKTLSNPTITGNATVAGTLATGSDITVGDDTSTTQRVIRMKMKNSTDSSAYELRVYLYQSTDSGLAAVVIKDGVEASRLQLATDGTLTTKTGGVTKTAVLDTDSGSINTGITAATGFTSTTTYRTRNGVCEVDVFCTRTGAAIAASASTGNFADTVMATLPVGVRPPKVVYGAVVYTSNGAAVGGVAYINTSGQIVLSSGAPGADLSTSGPVKTTLTYLI